MNNEKGHEAFQQLTRMYVFVKSYRKIFSLLLYGFNLTKVLFISNVFPLGTHETDSRWRGMVNFRRFL